MRKKSKVLEKINRNKVPSASRIKHLVMQLIPAVNNNSGAIKSIGPMLNSLNTLMRNHVVLLSLIQKKLNITDEEIEEEAASLVNESKKRAEAMRLQSEEAGTDEDSDGSQQSELLDAEVDRSDSGGSESIGEHRDGGRVCPGEPDTSDPVVSTSESND